MNRESTKIAEATLLMLEKKNWNSIKTSEIRSFKGINKNKFQKIIKNKTDLLSNINRFFDYKLIKLSSTIDKSTIKDMIFEIIMMRFDCLQNYRKSIIHIFNSFKNKPHELILLLPSFIESMVLIANLTKTPTKGIKGSIFIKGLLVIYFLSFLTWKEDNSKSLESTMTSLDKYLDQFINKIYFSIQNNNV